MGGLLLGNSRYWLKFRGVISNKSFNDLTESGYYKIEDGMADSPNGYWGMLVVFNDGSQLTQIFYPNIDTSDIMIRKAGQIVDIGRSHWRRISLIEM